MGEELGVDPLRRAAEREFPQGGEIAGGEVVGERAAGGLADIDLAVLEPLDQVVGGDVDDLDVVGAIDDRVGTVSRTRMRVIWATMSLRLSTCWMLTVV